MNKLSKLVALYDALHEELETLENEPAMHLCENWKRGRPTFTDPTGKHPRSALATGLEQGLREIPLLLKSLPPAARSSAAKALDRAIATHYPEFNANEEARLEKIKTRGRIRGENEFYLVRHQVDILEGDPRRIEELREWYGLVDEFESRGR